MPNPYDCDTTFEIVYNGHAAGFHVFRVIFTGQKALDACLFRNLLSTWLFNETDHQWFLGNGFGDSKDHPDLAVWSRINNPNGTDCFVLLESLADIARFEREFEVKGFSPTLVA